MLSHCDTVMSPELALIENFCLQAKSLTGFSLKKKAGLLALPMISIILDD